MNKLLDKAKDLFTEIKTHWDTPAEGKYVPYKEYITLTASLRDAGVTSALYLGTKKFGKQIDYAFKEGYTHIVIMGGSELENGTVKVKNLITREETEVKISSLPDFFNK